MGKSVGRRESEWGITPSVEAIESLDGLSELRRATVRGIWESEKAVGAKAEAARPIGIPRELAMVNRALGLIE